MSLLDTKKVRGEEFRVTSTSPRPWPANALSVDSLLATATAPVQSISSGWLLDQPVYRLAGPQGPRLVDASSGAGIVLSAELVQKLALATYTGPGHPGQAELLEPSLETRAHAGRVWRVAFSDREDTSVYLSQQGELLWHRNRSWRLYDFFWMLHIMDYSGRTDFNKYLLLSMAVGGLGLAPVDRTTQTNQLDWFGPGRSLRAKPFFARWRETANAESCAGQDRLSDLVTTGAATAFQLRRRAKLRPVHGACPGSSSGGHRSRQGAFVRAQDRQRLASGL